MAAGPGPARAAGASAASSSPTTAPRSTIGSGLRAGLDFEPFPFVDFDGGENYTPGRGAGRARRRIAPRQAPVDRAVRHVLRTLFAYGFFDRAAYVDDDSRIDRTGHAQEARRLAEAGTVLLQERRRAAARLGRG